MNEREKMNERKRMNKKVLKKDGMNEKNKF